MEEWKLCQSDYHFMRVVWEHEPVASGRLVTLCAQTLGWKKSTTYTVLRKLAQRGLVKNENAVVTALVKKQQVQAYESQYFVDNTFEGSLPQFLTAFLGGKTLSPREAEKLKRLIDAHREE
jgi:BlaI family penicillinase repressor